MDTNSVQQSTTRFEDFVDIPPATEEHQFDYRSSRRRSTSSKILMPRLSVAQHVTHHLTQQSSRVGHKIKFDFKGDVKRMKTPKETFSNTSFDNMLTQENINRSLEMKSAFRTSGYLTTTLTEVPSIYMSSITKARFDGNLYQEVSSKFSESEPPIIPLTMPESRFVSIGNSSEASLEAIWPWPWLPQNLSSSEYFSKSMQPVTFSLQDNLPPAPKQPLADVLDTFRSSVRLFLKVPKLNQLQKLIDDIIHHKGNGVGEDSDQVCGAVSCPWINVPGASNMMPLNLTRLEAPLSNKAILPPFIWDLWPERVNSQIDRAVILIQIVAEFARLVQSERLNVFYDDAGYPLCNHQFRKLFSSVKIPGIPACATHSFFKTIRERDHHVSPKHIVVICRGQMFSLDILQREQRTVPTRELDTNLRQIVAMSEATPVSGDRPPCQSVGVLTAIDRDMWSESRVQLMELSDNNRASLQKLEEAMFILSLDHMNIRGPERLAEDALFADGCNRWYDKGLSFYLYKNGLLTVNVCSSILDSSSVNALLRFMHIRILEDAEKWDDEVYKKSGLASRCVSSDAINLREALSVVSNSALLEGSVSKNELPSRAVATNDSPNPCHLVFDVNDDLVNSIREAKASFNKIEQSLSTAMCHFTGLENNYLEPRKINADAFAHLALQLTFYKMYFRPAAIATKVCLKRFYHGLWDTMVTTTPESIAWCTAMLNSDVSYIDRLELFRAAVDRHVRQMEETRAGLGCYRSLSSLRDKAVRSGDEYLIKVLDELAEFPAGSLETMDVCCETVFPKGSVSVVVVNPPSVSSYGVGYAMASGKVLFTVTAWKDNPGTCAENFAGSLHRCLKELQEFLIRA